MGHSCLERPRASLIFMKKILVATNNAGKIERYRKLLRGTDIELVTPKEMGIETVEVEENGTTLAENAELKARAYFGKTDLPILSNDAGFYIEGEGLVNAPKRIALDGKGEFSLSKEETAEALTRFWQEKAKAHGGSVDSAWVDEFVLLMPDGSVQRTQSRRKYLLTDTVHGHTHIQLPIRALYISKATGKPSSLHTAEEDDVELAPVRDALVSLLLP